MAEGEIELTRHLAGAADELKRPAGIRWQSHRELAIVVMGEVLKRNADLAQMVGALNLPGFVAGLYDSRK